jgi:hypothetical protein
MGLIRIQKRVCKYCKEEKEQRWRKGQMYCNAKCAGLAERGKNNPYWKGGNITYTCAECGLKFDAPRSRSKTKEQFCTQKCAKIKMGKNRRLMNHPLWNGGRVKTPSGYIKIHAEKHPKSDINGLIFEHRVVMEKHIGRYLKPEEVVHHINGIKDDNRIENLELFSDNNQHLRKTYWLTK